jgi:trigger factor
MPLVLGEDRLIPGFEDHLIGLRPGDETEFDITFPADYPEESLREALVHFSVTIRELRAKVLPEATDEWAQSLGDFADLAALKADVRHRLERSALDRARHHFADRIIDYSVKNASVDLPDVLVDEEVEVMRDELRGSLARQGMTEEAYLKAANKTADDLVADMRPAAEQRAKTLLVLGRMAEEEGVEVTDAEVNAEAEGAKVRYASQPKLVAYFDTDRARTGIRSTLRRSRVVEKIIDEWLADHPDHPALPHLEDGEPEQVLAPVVGGDEDVAAEPGGSAGVDTTAGTDTAAASPAGAGPAAGAG